MISNTFYFFKHLKIARFAGEPCIWTDCVMAGIHQSNRSSGWNLIVKLQSNRTCVVESRLVASNGCVVVTGVLAVLTAVAAAVVVAVVAGGDEETVVVLVEGTRTGTEALLGEVAGGVVEEVMMVGGGNACCGSIVAVAPEKHATWKQS